jgi:8-hydroxy-5-deazaflavin:NADPH oxidoreductase
MNISILGAGRMGGTLGKLWAKKNHSVFFGSRSAEKALDLARETGEKAGSYADAATFGDVIFIGFPWSAAESTLKELAPHLDGKIVIDCINALGDDYTSSVLNLSETSAGEKVQAWLPKSHVVKAYNTIGSGILSNGDFSGTTATGFYCGNNSDAKKTVGELIADSGFDPVDCGDIKLARHLETMTLLFITLSMKQPKGTQLAFKLLKR